MYNFFVDNNQIYDEKVDIVGKDVNHIENVLRMPIGQKVLICNKSNSESYIAEITEYEKQKVTCKLIEKIESKESKIKITVYQGLPKSDKMEYIIQKSVELGASRIIPVEMKYCVVKLNEKDKNKKIERWQAISESAAKQSKRNVIPNIEPVINFKELLNQIKEYDLSILAYENEEKITMRDVLSKKENIEKIAIIIGPEGGLSEEEVKLLINEGAQSTSLGKRILRTETASIAMLSMIMYEYEL